jgi:tRNA G10  N-methylase Trm11
MQEFEYYIKSNWTVTNHAATSISYSYTSRQVQDKKSKTSILNHVITMKIIWLDKSSKQLAAEKLTFINDTLAKSCEKQLKTINPSEATNKFRAAKHDIIRQLSRAKQQKINTLQQELNALSQYAGSNNDIIPPVMKGTETIIPAQQLPAAPVPKHVFDM